MPRGACGSEDLLGASGTVPDRIQCACAGFEGVRQRDSVVMVNEQCSECGFDGNTWTDETALEAVDCLPDRWAAAVANLAPEDVGRQIGRASCRERGGRGGETKQKSRMTHDTQI